MYFELIAVRRLLAATRGALLRRGIAAIGQRARIVSSGPRGRTGRHLVGAPSIDHVRVRKRIKHGLGLNLEQTVPDGSANVASVRLQTEF